MKKKLNSHPPLPSSNEIALSNSTAPIHPLALFDILRKLEPVTLYDDTNFQQMSMQTGDEISIC